MHSWKWIPARFILNKPMRSALNIKIYSPDYKDDWDDFVKQSFNATFLHYRDYMDYHADRFEDFSLMIFRGDALTALIPAHRRGPELFAHEGLTYGGWLWTKVHRTEKMSDWFGQILIFLAGRGISRWYLKDIPPFYAGFCHTNNRFVYRRYGRRAKAVDFWTIDTRRPLSSLRNADRRQSVREAGGWNLDINLSDNWEAFWDLLEGSLARRHGARPVHRLAEITRLHRLFPAHIRLWTVHHKGRLIAGAVVYETGHVARLQYLAGTDDKALRPAIDALVWHLIRHYYSRKAYIDMGSALGPGGAPDEGLVYWKESFGAQPLPQYHWIFDVNSIQASL